ncbi:response regulator [Candidatus Scalindua japonica]|uniref:Response regulator n=1 Tax=Candidatus Scalindua japonica TaxID=1284222 RepID=A0A286TWQ8_9BACT|nr:heavy metal response regulator transcription factor [Candidatus Scalindua japonica]GAX60271.1 response regulator [Candidatus Scalindua japonica]
MRILIVEDEEKMARYLKKGLEESSYVVDIALNGTDGLHLATHEVYDLLILDIMLPEHDGKTILKEVRSAGIITPVIFLTAKDSIADRVEGLNIGADDYIVKPFSFHELLARVRVCLRRGSHKTSSELTVGDLTLDPLTRKVFRGKKKIEMSPIEFSLLEYLMQHAGQVVTRTMISEHVWDSNFESFSNVVDVHIAKLRSKIDKHFDINLIHTQRGAGYVIEEPD